MDSALHNPILKRLLSQIDAFRLWQLDLSSLAYEFGGARGALDGAVARSIRDAVARTEGAIDYASVAADGARQRALALVALDAFEALIENEYRDPSSTT